MEWGKMRRTNVRTRVRNVSRSRVEGRNPTRSRITGRSPSPYEIGTPENYKNQRYREV